MQMEGFCQAHISLGIHCLDCEKLRAVYSSILVVGLVATGELGKLAALES